MRSMRTGVMAVAAAAVAVVVAAPGTATAAPKAAVKDSCPSGFVCFYRYKDWKGTPCKWDVQDPDWTSGTYKCSWATKNNVMSVWNAGTDPSLTGVAYYLKKNYGDRVGCTRQGHGGNLQGSYKVLSHRWVDGSCG
ncbi:peptidase inhibitor family I36 protein [Streptomyces sp. NPDC052301]|uniref:peptidase inhibitor family I36 protein n=1 Tax=Streptomyces sp. NPDC052301 TaxID=3365687 RepID=UPI0037D91716